MKIQILLFYLSILLLTKTQILFVLGDIFQKLDVNSTKVLFEKESLITTRKLSKISCLRSCNFRDDCSAVIFNPKTLVCKAYTILQCSETDPGETDVQVFKRIGGKS